MNGFLKFSGVIFLTAGFMVISPFTLVILPLFMLFDKRERDEIGNYYDDIFSIMESTYRDLIAS